MSMSSEENSQISPEMKPLAKLLKLCGVDVLEGNLGEPVLKVRTGSSWTANIISQPPKGIPRWLNLILNFLLRWVKIEGKNDANL